MQVQSLTLQDIREASSNYLRACLKEDLGCLCSRHDRERTVYQRDTWEVYHIMQDYFDEIHKALKEFHEWNGRSTKLKPLYMLIKVDVDADIVYNQTRRKLYARIIAIT